MAWTERTAATGGGSANAILNINVGGDWASGDLAQFAVYTESNTDVLPTPSGTTLIDETVRTNTTPDIRQEMFWAIHDGRASYTFDPTGTPWIAVVMSAWVHSSGNPLDANPLDTFGEAGGSSATPGVSAGITVATNDSLLVCNASNFSGNNTTAGTSGMDLTGRINATATFWKAANAGATGSITLAISSAQWVAHLIAFKPPSGGASPQTVTPTGFQDAATFGTAVVGRGGVTVTPTGFADGQAFGGAAVTSRYPLTPPGFQDAATFGTAAITVGAATVAPDGFANTTAFGTATVATGVQTVSPAGFQDSATFGTAVVGRGAVTVTPAGFQDAPSFGTAALTVGGVVITPTGFQDAATFGTATVGVGAVTLAPPGFQDAATFGQATLTYTQVIAAAGFQNAAAFGQVAVSIPAGQVAGVLASPAHLALGGRATAQATRVAPAVMSNGGARGTVMSNGGATATQRRIG